MTAPPGPQSPTTTPTPTRGAPAAPTAPRRSWLARSWKFVVIPLVPILAALVTAYTRRDPPEPVSTPPRPQPAVQVTPATQVTVNTAVPAATAPAPAPPTPAPDAAAPRTPDVAPSAPRDLSDRYRLIPGSTIELAHGVQLAVLGMMGTDEHMTVRLGASFWPPRGVEFEVGDPPIDVTIENERYRVGVARIINRRQVEVVLERRP